MSSHREAPEISKDPVADNTDVYAFVSPDKPDTVTLIANFIPFQNPQGGPNFYEFGDDVRYAIHVSNAGDARADVSYYFQFSTRIRNQNTFLYNTGPINKISDATWNRPQFYSVIRQERGRRPEILAAGWPCRRSTSESAARRTTPTSPADATYRCAVAGRCSPASGRRGSTSTWAASSTWARSDRSRCCI